MQAGRVPWLIPLSPDINNQNSPDSAVNPRHTWYRLLVKSIIKLLGRTYTIQVRLFDYCHYAKDSGPEHPAWDLPEVYLGCSTNSTDQAMPSIS